MMKRFQEIVAKTKRSEAGGAAMIRRRFQEAPKTEEVGRTFRSRAAALLAFSLLSLLLALPISSPTAQADPIEVDHFPNSSATVEIDIPAPGSVYAIVQVAGPTTVHVDLGSLADGDLNGREELQTEIVQMQLTGYSVPLGPITMRLRDSAKDPFLRTLGEMEENTQVQLGRLDLLGDNPPLCVEHPSPPPNCVGTTADSFFDVYFEVEVAGMMLHNRVPKHMGTTITHKPPAAGETYQSPEYIQLYDESGNPTNVWIGATYHTPKPVWVGGIVERPQLEPKAAVAGAGSSGLNALAIASAAAGGALLLAAGVLFARRRRHGY